MLGPPQDSGGVATSPSGRPCPLLLVGALAVMGCAAGLGCAARGAQAKPPVTPPERFSQTGAAGTPARWWQAFGSPTLNGLVRQALAGNLSLHAAWDRLDQARAVARKAGAARFPELNAVGSAGGQMAGGDGQLARYGNTASLSFGLAASYEVDLWGRVGAAREAAQLDYLATRESLKTAAMSVAGEVATTWLTLVERRGQLDLLSQQLATNQQVLRLVTASFTQGQGRAADVLQQRQQVDAIAGEQLLVQAEMQVLGHQLAILVGRPPGQQAWGSETQLPALPPLPRTGLPSELLRRRPDVQRAHLQVRAADHRVGAAVAERFPRLSLTAGATIGATFSPGALYAWLANLEANLLAPLIDGGARRAEVARTRAVLAETVHAYGQAVLDALREVEDALAREHHQAQYVTSLGQQLQLSERVVEQTRVSYLNGVEGYLRVLDALRLHQQLERRLLTARRDLTLSRVALYRALAGGWALQRPSATSHRGPTPRGSTPTR